MTEFGQFLADKSINKAEVSRKTGILRVVLVFSALRKIQT